MHQRYRTSSEPAGARDHEHDTDLESQQRAFAETIRSSSDTLLTLIDEVLDFKGRISREDWVEQAKALRDGG